MAGVSALAQSISMDTVVVGDAGNTGDPLTDGTAYTQTPGGFGSVNYEYRIGTYEVTNAQYAAFLNAVASTDSFGLYNTNMGNSFGGIMRSGSSGSYRYSAVSGRENNPVNYVSFWDAACFANWLTNGQGSGNTEDGGYTLTAAGITNNTVVRNDFNTTDGNTANETRWFVASENEWYKAAYYQPAGTGGDSDNYWLYPTATNSVPAFGPPPGGGNSANYDDPNSGDAGDVDNTIPVGAYTGSASYYGTFDQGGNVWEWNDEIIGRGRGIWGGSFINFESHLRSSGRADVTDPAEIVETPAVGFRVSSLAPIPEPSTVMLVLGALGVFLRRKRL